MSIQSFGDSLENLESLATSVQAGEVVFFVGAGLSVDSEGLTAGRLILRLLLRLDALERLQYPAKSALKRHSVVFKQLGVLFQAPPTLKEILHDPNALTQLAARYFEINEWMCRSYDELFRKAARKITSNAQFQRRLTALEKRACSDLPAGWTPEKFQRIRTTWMNEARNPAPATSLAALGKLLFVQTLGFHDEKVMGGTPFASIAHNFTAPVLRPRHHYLARFAREGFCPALLTTNFDLLLEAAFHLSGFGCAYNAAKPASTTLTGLQNFDVIASPLDFFDRGKAYRTATILKIHGCAGHLRDLHQTRPDIAAQLNYLPQLVYTYREIQNWRDDSWAADYLRTLLRTRTVVFAGYSTADPVIHDTFRSIYEEMQRKREDHANAALASPAPPPAPAYFLAYSHSADSDEFHASEILRAATLSTGAKTTPEHHPQYFRFRPLPPKKPKHPPPEPLFPTVDETFGWVQHRILRHQQTTALEIELPALIARLDKRRPSTEIQKIRADFERIVTTEKHLVKNSANSTEAVRHLHAILAWSDGFHLALRREWARALLLTRFPGRRREVADLEDPHWYFPASERPPWTAWSAVVELALRNLGQIAIGPPSSTPSGVCPVQATKALRPTVYLREHTAEASPLTALTIQVRGFERPGKRPALPGLPARSVIWYFHEDATPWTQSRNPGDEPAVHTTPRYRGYDHIRVQPDAAVLWSLALADPQKPSPEVAKLVRQLLPFSR